MLNKFVRDIECILGISKKMVIKFIGFIVIIEFGNIIIFKNGSLVV